MKRFLTISKTLLLAGLGLPWSCMVDYGFDYEYRIINETGKTIIVQAPQNNPETVAPAGDCKYIAMGGLCGKNYLPEDLFANDQSVFFRGERVEIHVKTTPDADYLKLSDDFKLRKYWTFESKKYLGVYTLRLTDDLMNELMTVED